MSLVENMKAVLVKNEENQRHSTVATEYLRENTNSSDKTQETNLNGKSYYAPNSKHDNNSVSVTEKTHNNTPLLDLINTPQDLKNLPKSKLRQLADELRHETIEAASISGGHFGGGLGVVELTVALHYVFKTPEDRLIWDVGHQAYPHKILTGRRDRIRTIRQPGGLYGFVKRAESEYDPFGTAHASTSISAGLGMAVARDLEGKDNQVIAVIGDGALTGGMAFEAINNAGWLKNKFLVILNDNNLFIDPAVGAISSYLCKLIKERGMQSLEDICTNISKKFPEQHTHGTKKIAEISGIEFDTLTGGSTMFENLGFHYLGPVNGHDIESLTPILEHIRNSINAPVLLHVVTEKGKGYTPAEKAKDKGHAVAKFNIDTGLQSKPKPNAPTYSKVFANALINEANSDDKIVAVTAAMPSGTGLSAFEQTHPKKFFDVAIAEQHAVTFAAGFATEGLKPFTAIYSTFLQRAYDQVIHDVAIQKLPVRFCLDRAGLVGADGPTHAGSYDIAYLGCLPNMVLMAPADEAELTHMIHTMAQIDDAPSAIRYPRGEACGVEIPAKPELIQIGKGRIVKEGNKVAILSYGTRLQESLKASAELEEQGISTTVVDARFAKPLDSELIKRIAKEHELIIAIEEGSIGGFGSFVMNFLNQEGLLDSGKLKFRSMFLPDYFIPHGKQSGMYEEAGLNARHIVNKVTRCF